MKSKLENSGYRNLQLTLLFLPVIAFLIFFLSEPVYAMPVAHQFPIYADYEDESFPANENKNAGPASIKTGLHSISFRARFSSFDVIGDVAEEEFWEYDIAAYYRSSWKYYILSGWGADVRLMSSLGVLYGDKETALVLSIIPLLAFGSQDGKFTLDMGAGGALLSRHKFGTQDYGGYFQFALTAGVSIPLFWQLGAGYRYLHYSDAAIYGPHNTGADFHMLELIYRF